ncbi:hypothetical protein N8D74_13160 [Curtobacterium flaccumfaciens]|uniref:Uncharacterized protein n=1 Tax=Curtobacterium poinsettiae TaxID=159612 RepID=A0A9Q9P5R4_9MICO|nr:hypothetical protein [Curtobacterium flaccumfaciens]UXN24502.1 hypothetical protein N8D74_13160 [Curtobacterium flaccumfaciens]UYC79338.1 hypothetical protein OE229_09235 [Curtobacterium flaccumfaciens pv. poinsettiae]
MRFDELLTRPDGPAIAESSPPPPSRPVRPRGLHQESRQQHWQFRVDIDEAAQT